MLLVQHLVEQDIRDHIFGNVAPVEPPVDYNLMERRIEAAELRSPGSRAPAQPRMRQAIFEIAPVQPVE